MKYIVVNTDLFFAGHLIPEGSVIELSELQSEGITNYLQPLEEKPVPKEINKKTKNLSRTRFGSN